jgi:hypothetical protein
MSTINLNNPITGTAGANGVYGNPTGTNGYAGGAAYDGVNGNSVYNHTLLTGGSGGTGVNLSSGKLTNEGGITGGAGGAAAADHGSYGFASHEFTDHALAHLAPGSCKA